ncbi:MAG: DinB family protein [Chloroflexi bacterium]|nr:DinB family protein [Chloroflexota bacterium]
MKNLAQIKRDLIAGLDRRRAEARALVESLPPELKIYADSDWRLRDLIIHLTALEADMIRAMQNAIAGAAFQVDLRGQATVEALYELRRRERAGESWRQVLDEWQRVRKQLRGLVLAFPADRMEARFSTPFFQELNLFEAVQACNTHESGHLAEIRAAARRDA